MAHVTLIRPAQTGSADAYAIVREPSLGLAYVASSLEAAGHGVAVIDALGEAPDTCLPSSYGLVAFGLSNEDVVKKIPEKTDGIGLSVMFSQQWPHAENLVSAIRRRFPTTPIFLGGEHGTACWDYVLRTCPDVVCCALGEGEHIAVELAEWLDGKRALDSISGLAMRIDGKPAKTVGRPRVKKPEELPHPAWHLVPLQNYFSRGLYGMGVDRGRSLPIIATRGCPFQCTFCSSPRMWTTKYVTRDPKDVVDEIEGYIQKYQINNVDFEDLTAFIKKDWILALCKELEDRNIHINLQLPVGTRSETLDREVLQALFRVGVTNIAYAPESGSERTLDRIKKKVHLDRMMESIKTAAEIGMIIKVNIIIGFPFEERADVMDTVRFCMKLAQIGVEDVQIYPYAAYPGTELYDELRRDGVLPPMSNEYFASLTYTGWGQSSPVCRSMSPRELAVHQLAGMGLAQLAGYASHPQRFLRTAKNLATGKHESIAERLLAKIIQAPFKPLIRTQAPMLRPEVAARG